MPATSAGLPRLLFLLQPLTVLMKQTRQVVHTIDTSILLRCLWGDPEDHRCLYSSKSVSANLGTWFSKVKKQFKKFLEFGPGRRTAGRLRRKDIGGDDEVQILSNFFFFVNDVESC